MLLPAFWARKIRYPRPFPLWAEQWGGCSAAPSCPKRVQTTGVWSLKHFSASRKVVAKRKRGLLLAYSFNMKEIDILGQQHYTKN